MVPNPCVQLRRNRNTAEQGSRAQAGAEYRRRRLHGEAPTRKSVRASGIRRLRATRRALHGCLAPTAVGDCGDLLARVPGEEADGEDGCGEAPGGGGGEG